MYKLLHIHSDSKFLYSIDKYAHELLDNTMLIIGAKDDTNAKYQDTAIFFERNAENVDRIVEYAKSFNLIIFEDLTAYNKKILMKIPVGIKIIWRFFGHELYNKRFDLILTDSSIAVGRDQYKIYTKKGGLKNYYLFLRKKYSFIYNLYKYVKKIDYILLYSKEEYGFLRRHWFFLPKPIIAPLLSPPTSKRHHKENFIIFGHSKNIINNHLDVLKIINNSKNPNPFKTKMFLSYGYENSYYKKLVEEVSNNTNIEMILDFLPKDEFNNIYSEASALVINSHRQAALGNIFIAISNNCKLYLNNRNIIKKWLENEGLKVFSIEDFKRDYEVNNLKLSQEDAKHNISIVHKMNLENNLEVFQAKILEIVRR